MSSTLYYRVQFYVLYYCIRVVQLRRSSVSLQSEIISIIIFAKASVSLSFHNNNVYKYASHSTIQYEKILIIIITARLLRTEFPFFLLLLFVRSSSNFGQNCVCFLWLTPSVQCVCVSSLRNMRFAAVCPFHYLLIISCAISLSKCMPICVCVCVLSEAMNFLVELKNHISQFKQNGKTIRATPVPAPVHFAQN